MARLTFARGCRCLPAVLVLPAGSALASGQEGAAMVGAVQLIVGVTLLILAVSLVGGVAVGARRAHRDGEPLLKGAARGVLKGILAFLVACGVVAIVATVAGFGFIVFSLFTAPLATPS